MRANSGSESKQRRRLDRATNLERSTWTSLYVRVKWEEGEKLYARRLGLTIFCGMTQVKPTVYATPDNFLRRRSEHDCGHD